MGLYLCRWENGDFSVIQANNKDHALEMLDEVANAEGLPLYSIRDFMVHFRLTDEGMIELEDFGEEFGEHIREHVHPVLGGLVLEFINTVTYFRPSGIHGLEARATLTGSRGTGFQPVKLRSLLHSAPVAEYVTIFMKPCT